ncbi:hypothetical protein [Oceanobacillus halophilus]|uniref:Yip1 domain-containing protein n=1 Tax=Oceanobacillus halophilus TaxID=930130 RepID=A0A494ZZV9_9BACI|nr:hypothetical protein [Oceanobacillus halophilus]RKQ32281.1 hypothetical protein D8M06_12925 [Oceanobacillus halophilus]
MTYYTNPISFFRAADDHIHRIIKAEQIVNLWRVCFFLVIFSMLIYGWTAYLGVGSNLISEQAVTLSNIDYEVSKFWFIIGRFLWGLIFALFILFIPSLLYYLLTDIPYQKLLIMQQIVLVVLLVERLIWVPMALLIGLDWYVSPLSFGVIASYLTDTSWIIYFFGTISLFQIWVIWFQAKYLISLSQSKKYVVWLNVILLHIVSWCLVTVIAFADSYLINGWFN